VQAYVAEFRFTETEIAEAEGQVIEVGVEFGEKPGSVAVGGKELYDGFEVEALILAVDRGELGTSVLEELLTLGESDELYVFVSGLGGPQRSVQRTDGPRRVRPESNAAHQSRISHGSKKHRSTGRDSGFALARPVRFRAAPREAAGPIAAGRNTRPGGDGTTRAFWAFRPGLRCLTEVLRWLVFPQVSVRSQLFLRRAQPHQEPLKSFDRFCPRYIAAERYRECAMHRDTCTK
jgi:hypothetical protein